MALVRKQSEVMECYDLQDMAVFHSAEYYTAHTHTDDPGDPIQYIYPKHKASALID